MAETYKFRGALSGFNRKDVVQYIEYLSTKHNNLVNQLKSENQALKEELAALRAGKDTAAHQADTQEQVPENLADAELEAYRRAERMERNAKERSEEIYRKATATLAEASAQLDSAVQHYSSAAETISAQLNELRSAVETSKTALENASATMYAIRPENTEE